MIMEGTGAGRGAAFLRYLPYLGLQGSGDVGKATFFGPRTARIGGKPPGKGRKGD